MSLGVVWQDQQRKGLRLVSRHFEPIHWVVTTSVAFPCSKAVTTELEPSGAVAAGAGLASPCDVDRRVVARPEQHTARAHSQFTVASSLSLRQHNEVTYGQGREHIDLALIVAIYRTITPLTWSILRIVPYE